MKKQEYLECIKNYINKTPKLSCELTDKLVKCFGVTSANARKIISNFVKAGKLYRFDDIKFDSGSMLIYKTNNSSKFLEAAKKYKEYINIILKEIDKYKVISKFQMCKLAAASLDEKSKKRTFDNVLSEIRLFRNVKFYKHYIVYSSLSDKECEEIVNKVELIDKNNMRIIASLINMHLSMNLIVRENLKYRSENFLEPKYIDNVFDIIALSKCYSDRVSECICLYDVDVINEVNEFRIKTFYDRIQNVTNNNVNKNKAVGFVVYMDITNEAIKFAKQHGLMLVDICKLFGNKIKIIFDKISNLSIPECDISSAEEVLELIEQSGQSENLGNIKGELFERIIYNIVKEIYNQTETIFKRKVIFIYDQNINREIDILVECEQYDEIILIECKSSKHKIPLGFYNKKDNSYTKDSVKYFYNVYSLYSEKNKGGNVKFVFFAANGFEEDAIKKMKTYSDGLKAKKLELYYDYYSAKNNLLSENKKIKDDIACWEKYFLYKE